MKLTDDIVKKNKGVDEGLLESFRKYRAKRESAGISGNGNGFTLGPPRPTDGNRQPSRPVISHQANTNR